jgi:DNA-binding beta-propeller fold protein YncE
VGAVLGDTLHRVSILGGREGMPRSLGSVYAGSVTRFLGGGLRGVESGVIAATAVTHSFTNGVAVSHDGRSVLLSAAHGDGNSVVEVGLGLQAGGVIGTAPAPRIVDGTDPACAGAALRFIEPAQVCVASDGFVFIADHGKNRVVVLHPDLTFYSIIGKGELYGPSGVCANADVVVVTQTLTVRVSVLRRDDGALIRHFSSQGQGRGQLHFPLSICFLPGDTHVAVTDAQPPRSRVSIFSVDGDFIRAIGAGLLGDPRGVACSIHGELVVADAGYRRVCVFDADDVLARAFGDGNFTGVAVHGCAVIAIDNSGSRCLLFT